MCVIRIRAFHVGVKRFEQADGIGLEKPNVKIVVVEGGRLRWCMTLHRPIEWLAKERRPFLHARCQRNEPFCPDELHLIADGLIEENLRPHRVGNRTHQRAVHEVNAHTRTGVVPNTEDPREVTFANRDDNILIFLERFTDILPVR